MAFMIARIGVHLQRNTQKAGKADDIAKRWLSRLDLMSLVLPHLCILTNETLAKDPIHSHDMLDIQLSTRKKQQFGMLLSCKGLGKERCSVPPYAGKQFWDSDTFEDNNLGLNNTTNAEIVISGGGDGALQDYLRILTRKTAGQLYEGLRAKAAAINPVIPYIFASIEKALQAEEEQAQRAFSLSSSKNIDHSILDRLHAAHIKQVDRLLQVHAIIQVMDSFIPDISVEIHLLHACHHFSNCYAFNRFLALLISRYLSQFKNKQTILSKTRLASVKPVGHNCGDPNICHGKPHELTYHHASCMKDHAHATEHLKANVIIIRHGIQPNQLSYGDREFNSRQLLPLHVP